MIYRLTLLSNGRQRLYFKSEMYIQSFFLPEHVRKRWTMKAYE